MNKVSDIAARTPSVIVRAAFDTCAMCRHLSRYACRRFGLTMRWSDAGPRCRRQAKLIYPNHRLSPCLNEDATRDRSNRLLDPSLTTMLPNFPWLTRQRLSLDVAHPDK